jgi:hypothetical protein
MSHLDKRRVLDALSVQLLRGETLSPEQSQYLGVALWRIANGEDANAVLEVRPKQGHRQTGAIARQRMSLILHWVAAALESDPTGSDRPLSVEQACQLAVDSIVPAAKQAFPGGDSCTYDFDYIMRCWSDPSNEHMRSPSRKFYDDDFPY